jgi:hypothetical protein
LHEKFLKFMIFARITFQEKPRMLLTQTACTAEREGCGLQSHREVDSFGGVGSP